MCFPLVDLTATASSSPTLLLYSIAEYLLTGGLLTSSHALSLADPEVVALGFLMGHTRFCITFHGFLEGGFSLSYTHISVCYFLGRNALIVTCLSF